LRFASELKNRLLHIFRLEAKASAEAAGEKKDRSGKSRELERRRVEDIIGKGSAVAERMPLMPQTVFLRADVSPAFENTSAKRLDFRSGFRRTLLELPDIQAITGVSS
jgi:hypothetical protein